MNRIESIFSALRAGGRKGLMPFVCGGHPTAEATAELLPVLDRSGASIIEIGIPFSDPIADGPVIAEAMHEALTGTGAGAIEAHAAASGSGRSHDSSGGVHGADRPVAGVTPLAIFDQVASVRSSVRAGLVAMCSVSIVHRMGLGAAGSAASGGAGGSAGAGAGGPGFFELAARAGIDGVIVPDAPLEEAEPMAEAARRAGLCCALLVAPTSQPERARRIAAASTGFIYMLARVGITGESHGPPEIASRVEMLRALTDLPIAVGFGVSTPEHVRAVVRHADAAIVGSALVRRLSRAHAAGENWPAEAERFTRELASAL